MHHRMIHMTKHFFNCSLPSVLPPVVHPSLHSARQLLRAGGIELLFKVIHT